MTPPTDGGEVSPRGPTGDAVAVSIVGSTGSVGVQALDVVRAEPERFRVVALAAWRSVEVLAAQAHEFRPEVVAIGDVALAPELTRARPP